MTRRSVHSKIRRCREWLWWFAHTCPQRCYVCGKLIPPDAFVNGDVSDGVLLHHIRMDRDTGAPKMLKVAHRSCHRRFHRALEERGEDVRTDMARYMFGPTPKCRSTRKRRSGYLGGTRG